MGHCMGRWLGLAVVLTMAAVIAWRTEQGQSIVMALVAGVVMFPVFWFEFGLRVVCVWVKAVWTSCTLFAFWQWAWA